MWRYIFGNYGTGSDNRAATDMDPVGHHGIGAQPDIVLHNDALGGYTLFDERTLGIIDDMVNGNELCHGRGVNPVADRHAALAAYDTVFADQAVAPNADAGMGQAAEVIDVQHSAVHD